MFKKFAVAAALALLTSSSFAAAPTGIYGGLDVGSTKFDDLDGNKTSFGGFLGYGFNRFLAVEAGYRRLGKWNLYGADMTVNQTFVTLVASLPLSSQLDLYGRAGQDYLRGDVKYGGMSENWDSDGGMLGVGLNYSFAPNLSGRLEVQKPSTDSTNVHVGIVYKF
jgi:OOP family OmpA-OmpF porin